MRLRVAILFVLCAAVAGAQQATPIPFSVPPADAPELATRGSYAVGVRTVELVHEKQADILHVDQQTGKAPLYDRRLKVELWYPATIPAGKREETVYQMPVPGGHGFGGSPVFEIPDKALRDAPPLAGTRFPLVVVSHGYPGSRYFLSYFGSNLASKGYVVAAIDSHRFRVRWCEGFRKHPAQQVKRSVIHDKAAQRTRA